MTIGLVPCEIDPTTNQSMLEEIRSFIEAHEWKFAKTMPQCPHYYVVRDKVRDEQEFVRVVQFIREFGYDECYRPGAPVQRYVDIDGWKYWTMGYTVGVTVIINRAERDWVKRPIRRNPKPWVCRTVGPEHPRYHLQ